MKLQKKIAKKYLNFLNNLGIISYIGQLRQFSDDPQLYNFGLRMKALKKHTDGSPFNADSAGFSVATPEQALSKCVTEAMERYSQVCYRDTDLIFNSHQSLKTDAFDPELYEKRNMRTKKIGWIQGYEITGNKRILLPAQLFYLNYKHTLEETMLSAVNSTGAAGGFDHESTLCRSIYEVIERDSFMTTYLTKSPIPRVNLRDIKDKKIKQMIEITKRYNFELYLFNITTDIGVPTFLAALVDRTGLGPGVSLGAKSSLSPLQAAKGALEESFQTRWWMRRQFIMRRGRKFSIAPSKIRLLEQRGAFWSSPHMIKHFLYLLKTEPRDFYISDKQYSSKKELQTLVGILKEKKLDAFYADITFPPFKQNGFIVYKTIMPKLQMLILDETKKTIMTKRLQAVSKHFGQNGYLLNKVPQPFL